MSLTAITAPRLIVAAAMLHLFLAVALFTAGRAGVAPALIDRDGIMGSFAYDSYDYQRGAIEVTQMLRSGNVIAWATAAQPLHVKLIAVPFALLSPLFGYSTLSAEPYNLICYLGIVGLVFALGRELSGHRVAVLSAAVVALWPTFQLHTLQLLKDPLFVAAALAFLLCAITSLVRTYPRSIGAGVTAIAVLLVLLLHLVRFSFVLMMVAIAVLILALLILRQARERRLLFWNMAPALAVLLTALSLLPFYSHHNIERIKTSSSDQGGPSKTSADPAAQVPTLVMRIAHPETAQHTPGDKAARRISSIRSRFAAAYANSGSLLDTDAEFRNVNDLIRYVPRAMEIGLWAPFPHMWVSAGRRVGNVGKLLSGAETLAVYVLELLAVVALVREPRRIALWFVVALVVFGATALAFIVPNVGAIYRFRYVFWMLLVVAGMTGLNALLISRQHRASSLKRSMIAVLIVGLLAGVPGCSSLTQASHRANATAANCALTNFTGTSFRALYLSPSSASGWQENVLAGSELKDGDTLDVQLDPTEKNIEWDMRVEGVDGRYAEWKNLKLGELSDITLVLKLAPGPTVVAEVE
ncbi:MAG TPA: hypothetical protein VFH46_05480 [Pyrinomonadaceae bacterium]|nr:hypothetical protein [Pyrinomonadaceae bacterium]